MKTWKNIALVAIVAIIGLFGFVGCGDGDGNGTGGSGNSGTGGGGNGDGDDPAWVWSVGSDIENGGKSTISFLQNNGTITVSGSLIGDADGFGNYTYVYLVATPNPAMLEKLKTTKIISFDFKGDGKEDYDLRLRQTHMIEDNNWGSYAYRLPSKNVKQSVTLNVPDDFAQPIWGKEAKFIRANVVALEFNLSMYVEDKTSFSFSVSDLTLGVMETVTAPDVYISIEDLVEYLNAQPNNNLYEVKLNVNELPKGYDWTDDKEPIRLYSTLVQALQIENKYVSLDLSDSTFTSIPNDAFYECTSLVSVTIPNSVTSILNSAFLGCTSLVSITVAENNTAYSSADGVLFNKDKTALIKYPAGKTDTAYSIPNSVTSMEILAFAYCTSLTSVTIPNSVTSISNSAFAGCTNLTSVTIPNSVTTIERQAFLGCTSLVSITIPASVTSIQGRAFTSMGGGAFEACTSLTSINVDSANTAYNSTDGVLFNKVKTSLVVYPAGKTDATYTIPNSVTSIESGAFSGCTSLESVTIPNSVTTIGSSAFSGCTSLTSVTFEGVIAEGVGYDDDSFTGFSSNAFAGNLYTSYFNGGGVGTYKTNTPVPSDPDDWNPIWTKQP